MTCPTCHAETYVTRTHGSRRMRRCLGCGRDFETVEVLAHEEPAFRFHRSLLQIMRQGNGDHD